MSSSQFSSLSCELRIIQAKNIEFKTTGNNGRIRLNTREIFAKSNHVWNESISLDCSGGETDAMDSCLKQESVVFELHWRSTVPGFGRIGGSQLLVMAEVQWKKSLSRQTWS